MKDGEAAGVTCLTLEPVLALVSMNMTFSSLALCSPSSIMICLQEIQPDSTSQAESFKADVLLRVYCPKSSQLQLNVRVNYRSAFPFFFFFIFLPLLLQICLVAYEHDDDVASSLCPDVVNPFAGLLE